jgi:peptidoglycan/LPS O-acetylase OafA/YrhL
MQLLGKISFPLYLVQYPVFISFTSWMIAFAAAHSGIDMQAAMTIGVISLAVCLVAAFLFLPVEWLTKWIGTKAVSVLYNP